MFPFLGQIGKDADRLDIEMFPVPFDCAWDILGDRHQVCAGTDGKHGCGASLGGAISPASIPDVRNAIRRVSNGLAGKRSCLMNWPDPSPARSLSLVVGEVAGVDLVIKESLVSLHVLSVEDQQLLARFAS